MTWLGSPSNQLRHRAGHATFDGTPPITKWWVPQACVLPPSEAGGSGRANSEAVKIVTT